MKSKNLLVAAIVGLMFSGVAVAEKYGVIDMQTVILTVKDGKDARKTLEVEIKAKEKELKAQKVELDAMNAKWKKNMALMNETAKMKEQQKFQEKFMGLRQAEMAFQQEIKRKEQKATQKIAIKVAKLVETLAKEGKFDAVFETNSSGLMYLKKPIDLTQKVIKAFDAQSSKVAKKKSKVKKSSEEM